MNIRPLPEKHPKSPAALVEILRGHTELAFNEKITFLEITATVNGQTRTISITCP